MRTFCAAPRASILIESMRDIGYSLETALADVIDNSITAGASKIQLFVDTEKPGFRIGILDNGKGMTQENLLEAMRPGSRSPLEKRDNDDLGRFGLGLKTASFSQCRRLIVITRRDAVTSAAIWDLDHVAQTDEWLLQIPNDPLTLPWAEKLGENGTFVVWENLDRFVQKHDSDKGQAHFIRRIDDTREHLELVFHRFLSGEGRNKKIHMFLNERPLEPIDPFHSNHPATIAGPLERIKIGSQSVEIQAFTLPHHQKVSHADWERYAGRAGYIKNQGFYVYRERRLIIYGTWFGLARQMELTKLARVRIDMSNGLDAEWKIDVKKSSAQPPNQVRRKLGRLIETIGATSKRVYTARGRKLTTDSRLPVWNRVQDKNEIIYRLNTEHPVFVDFASRLPDELKDNFSRIMELAGSTLPMNALFSDFGGNPENVKGDAISEETLRETTSTTIRQLIGSGRSLDDISDMLHMTELFRSHWEIVKSLLDEYSQERHDL